jgi:hypothetical protein
MVNKQTILYGGIIGSHDGDHKNDNLEEHGEIMTDEASTSKMTVYFYETAKRHISEVCYLRPLHILKFASTFVYQYNVIMGLGCDN